MDNKTNCTTLSSRMLFQRSRWQMFHKMGILKISQNRQANTCAGIPVLIKF